MASPSYDVQTYLLDRANVYDTITKLGWYYDTRNAASLATEVYAPDVVIDYTKLLGGEPYVLSGQAWAAQVGKMLAGFDSAQHVNTCVLPCLPQPGASVQRPDKCTAHTQVQGNMVRKDARGGPMMQNGGICTFELVRLPSLESQGQNPWRISRQEIEPKWEKGNLSVMTVGAAAGAGTKA